jgi:hypothetical protein
MKYLKNKLEIGHGEIVLALGVAGILVNYYYCCIISFLNVTKKKRVKKKV